MFFRGIFMGVVVFMASSGWAQRAPYEEAKPWLGVAIDKGPQGVLVKEVLAETPAAQAGFKAGDQITAIDDVKVNLPEELIRTVQAQGIGNSVIVHYLRAGAAAQVSVKLVARPDQLELLRSKLVGKPAPAFKLPVAYGKDSGSSKDLKGKVVVIEFWATWCPACRSTHARLSAFARKYKGKIPVLAVTDDEDGDLGAYLKAHKVDFTILQDKAHATQSAWFVSAIPEIAVVNKQGVVSFVTMGAGSYLEEALAAAEELHKSG